MLFIINYYIINAIHITESAGDKPGWPTLSSPDIITPRHPSGFTATGANILIPEVTKKDIITDMQGHSASFHLRGYIEQVSPEVQRSYIDQLRRSGYSQIARSVHIRSLPPEDQLAEVRRQLESSDIKQTLSEEDMLFLAQRYKSN